MKRLLVALALLGLLAFAAFQTLSDVRFRSVTLAILALCAVKIWIAHKRLQEEAQETDLSTRADRVVEGRE
jgi:hypothetical protein